MTEIVETETFTGIVASGSAENRLADEMWLVDVLR